MGMPGGLRAVIGALVVVAIYSSLALGGVVLNTGDIVVADQMVQASATADGRLIQVNPLTGQQTLITSGGMLFDPTDVALDAAGMLLVSDFNSGPSGAIIQVNPLTGLQTLMTPSGLPGRPTGVTVDGAGFIYVSCPGRVIRIDPVTKQQSTVASGSPLNVTEQLKFFGSTLYCADAQSFGAGKGTVIRINPATGSATRVSSALLALPTGVAVLGSGELLVAEHDTTLDIARIDRMNPTSGAVTMLSDHGMLKLPARLDWTLDGRVVVADLDAFNGFGGVIGIDLASGAQSIVSQGGMFQNPTGIAVVPEPSGLALLIAGVGAALARRRRFTSSRV